MPARSMILSKNVSSQNNKLCSVFVYDKGTAVNIALYCQGTAAYPSIIKEQQYVSYNQGTAVNIPLYCQGTAAYPSIIKQ